MAFDDVKNISYPPLEMDSVLNSPGWATRPDRSTTHPASPLPRARDKEAGIEPTDIDRYLGVIEARVKSEQTGRRWMVSHWQIWVQPLHETSVSAK